MKRIVIIFIILLGVVLLIFFTQIYISPKQSSRPSQNTAPNSDLPSQPSDSTPPQTQTTPPNQTAPGQNNNGEFQPPLDRAAQRVTKKPFGIFITPQNSPVQPERFRGYHTGADFETFPDEVDAAVSVQVICDGTIAEKKYASGYGGVMVQNCELNQQPITVIYGHLKLASVAKNAGDMLNAGEQIGILGKGYSPETDGERKHLHLGIHNGKSISILGYVQSKNDLAAWIDPCLYVCR